MIDLHVSMSLDGFIAGPEHDMSWTGGAEYDTSSQLADEVARSTGVVLAGRRWYGVASADEWRRVAGIYGGAWSGPVLVLTHHPERIASDATVEADLDLKTALARAEEFAGVGRWASGNAAHPFYPVVRTARAEFRRRARAASTPSATPRTV
jgi:dihydrofolate reductase